MCGTINDLENFGRCRKEHPKVSAITCSNITDKRVVTMKINELLPALKELTEAVGLHWGKLIHTALAEESKTGIPRFNKAFVLNEITIPKTHRCGIPQTELSMLSSIT